MWLLLRKCQSFSGGNSWRVRCSQMAGDRGRGVTKKLQIPTRQERLKNYNESTVHCGVSKMSDKRRSTSFFTGSSKNKSQDLIDDILHNLYPVYSVCRQYNQPYRVKANTTIYNTTYVLACCCQLQERQYNIIDFISQCKVEWWDFQGGKKGLWKLSKASNV